MLSEPLVTKRFTALESTMRSKPDSLRSLDGDWDSFEHEGEQYIKGLQGLKENLATELDKANKLTARGVNREQYEETLERRRTKVTEQLQRLDEIWGTLSGKLFHDYMIRLNPTESNPYKLLECLAVPVVLRRDDGPKNLPLLKFMQLEGLWQQVRQYEFEEVLVVRHPQQWSEFFGQVDIFALLERETDKVRFHSTKPLPTTPYVWQLFLKYIAGNLNLRGNKVEFRVAYTSAVKLFRPFHAKEQAYVIQAIKDMPLESNIYGTVMCRAILAHSWNAVQFQFALRCLLQAFTLFVLVYYIGTGARLHYVPGAAIRNLVGVLGCVDFFVFIVDIVGAKLVYGSWTRALLYYLRGWNFFIVIFQLYSIIVITWMSVSMWWSLGTTYKGASFGNVSRELNITITDASGKHMCNQDNYCGLWLHDHPVLLVFLIGARGYRLSVDLLCVRALGEHVVPAYNAVMSETSTRFLFYVLLLTLMSFCAFYVLPVDTDKGVMHTFFLMFRLCINGDFDLGDLEGVNQKVDMTTGEIDDGEPTKLYHQGVRVLFVILSVGINIVMLNVYVGLLSSLYDSYAEKRRQLFAEYRAMHIWKLLCASYIYREVLGYLHLDCIPDWMGMDANLEEEGKGLWIAYNANHFKDELVDSDENIDVIYNWVQAKLDQAPPDRSISKNARNFW